MITFEEALTIIHDNVQNTDCEQVYFENSLFRIISEDVVSDIDMPPFNKSAVDGYACKSEDLTDILDVIDIVQAGQLSNKIIGKNQCVKIMTGAPVPSGADCVVMVEDTIKIDTYKIRCNPTGAAPNICYFAEDIKQGEIVIKKNQQIQPQHIALMASVGHTNPYVYKQPRIGVLATGNELVEPTQKPIDSQIRNSNGYQLISQLRKIRFTPINFGIAQDNELLTQKKIAQAFENCDILIITGGVSVGDFDFVPKVLTNLKFETLFQTISMQPGKPVLLAKKENKYCFGLPGNPVSSFIQFELLVKPLIYNFMGAKMNAKFLKIPLKQDFIRKKSQRKAFIPIFIDQDGFANLIDYHGSAHIASLSEADGLLIVDIGVEMLKKNDLVHVRLF